MASHGTADRPRFRQSRGTAAPARRSAPWVSHAGNTLRGSVVTHVIRKLRCSCLALAGLFPCHSAAADAGTRFVLELRTFGGVATHRLRVTDEATYRPKEAVDFDAI